jgi:hypothetical protein
MNLLPARRENRLPPEFSGDLPVQARVDRGVLTLAIGTSDDQIQHEFRLEHCRPGDEPTVAILADALARFYSLGGTTDQVKELLLAFDSVPRVSLPGLRHLASFSTGTWEHVFQVIEPTQDGHDYLRIAEGHFSERMSALQYQAWRLGFVGQAEDSESVLDEDT